jgi:hypothetical protein
LPRSGKPKVAVAKSSVSSTTTSGGAAKKPGVPSVGKINALTRGGPAKRR